MVAEQTVHRQPRGEPLSSKDWINCFDQQGRIRNVDFLREKIYHGVIILFYCLYIFTYGCNFREWNLL